MGSFSFVHWFVVFFGIVFLYMICLYVIIGIPVARILHRTGMSRWWSLLILVPVVNLIGFWVFAFARWPEFDAPKPRQPAVG
jgi:uncharacterized membrane protein YhaH (DUF805 family)